MLNTTVFKLDMIRILRFGIVFVLDFVLCEIIVYVYYCFMSFICGANKFCCFHFSTVCVFVYKIIQTWSKTYNILLDQLVA